MATRSKKANATVVPQETVRGEDAPIETLADALYHWATTRADVKFKFYDGAIIAAAPDGEYWFRGTYGDSDGGWTVDQIL